MDKTGEPKRARQHVDCEAEQCGRSKEKTFVGEGKINLNNLGSPNHLGGESNKGKEKGKRLGRTSQMSCRRKKVARNGKKEKVCRKKGPLF